MSSSTPPEQKGTAHEQGTPSAVTPVPLYRRSLFWVLLGMLLTSLALFLLLRGCSVAPVQEEQPPQASGGQKDDGLTELLALQRAHNKGLEEEVLRLQQLMREDPCALSGLLGPSPEQTPLPPGYAKTPPAGNATLPPSGNATAPSSLAHNATAQPLSPVQPPSTVAELMDQATVFILSEYQGTVGMGSGFCVAPGVIATNRHVVQNSEAQVLVGNKVLGGMQECRILAFSNDANRDYALLRVDDALASRLPALRIAETAKRTDRVSAWGFPGYITEIDPKLRALALGDIKAVPEVVYSEGVISVVLDNSPPAILHTAAISQGNSGGPLVNPQGAVVGINTFIKKADQSYSQTNIALPGEDLVRFMREHGVTPLKQDN